MEGRANLQLAYLYFIKNVVEYLLYLNFIKRIKSPESPRKETDISHGQAAEAWLDLQTLTPEIASIEERRERILELYSGKINKSLPKIINKQVSDYGKVIVDLENIAKKLNLEVLPTLKQYYCIYTSKNRYYILIDKQSLAIYIADFPNNVQAVNNAEMGDLLMRKFDYISPDNIYDYLKIESSCSRWLNHRIKDIKSKILHN